ncbi:MAG: hypothetical protein RSB80_07865 [Anaerovoracaceae bacterium]
MIKLYEYIENPNIYAIFDKAENLLIYSSNPNAARGIIVMI